MKYKLVILDLGNVLINFNHWVAANKFLSFSPRKLNDIYNLLFDSPLLHTFEAGKIGAEDFFLAVKKDLSLDIDYNKFLPIWNEIFYLTSDNVEVHRIVNVLKERFKVIVLSNINQLHFQYLKDTFRIFDPFHKIILSYEVGLRKPEAGAYQYTLDLFKVSSAQAFYIDDRIDLIEAAARLSIDGLQFKSAADLKSTLENLEILDRDEKPLPVNPPNSTTVVKSS